MNAKLIIDQAILHKGMPIDFLYAKRFLNEAMSILSSRYDNACTQLNKTIVSTDNNTYYSLDSNIYGVIRVTDSRGYKYDDYVVDFDTIKFGKNDTYTVTQLALHPDIINENSVPGIHSAYHYPLSFYVAAADLDRIKPGDMKAKELYTRFFIECENVNARLSRVKRRGAKLPKPVWR